MHKILSLAALLSFIPISLDAQDKIYWSDTYYHKIMRANTDGAGTEELLSGSIPGDVVIDTLTQKLYWSDYGTNMLRSASVDGSDQQVLLSGLNYPLGLDIDLSAGHLYCAEYDGGRIIRCNLDGSGVTTLLTGLDHPYDVALNLAAGQMYWTERPSGKIWKAQLDGSGKTEVLASLTSPNEIHIDAVGGYLYWQQYPGGIFGSGILRSKLDGSAKTMIINNFSKGFSVDRPRNRILWISFATKTLYQNNLNGSNQIDLFKNNPGMGLPGTFTGDWSKGKVYWLDYLLDHYIYQANTDGSSRKPVATQQIYYPTSFAVDSATNEIYWVNGQSSYSQDQAGAVMKGKSNTDIQQLVSSGGRKLYAFALDAAHSRMYWTDLSSPAQIMGSNMDGAQVTSIVSSDLGAPVGLGLDVAKGKIYWIDQSKKRIERANLDGSDREILLTTDINLPYTLKLDLENRKMYWSDEGDQKILRANLDGTDVETVVIEGVTLPRDLAIDPGGDKLYWADAGFHKIYRSTLDGTQVKVIDYGAIYTQQTGVFLMKGASSKVSEVPIAPLVATPNPASNQVVVQHLKIPDRIVVYDLKGVLIAEVQADALTTLIDISQLPVGIYQVVSYLNGLPIAAGNIVKQ